MGSCCCCVGCGSCCAVTVAVPELDDVGEGPRPAGLGVGSVGDAGCAFADGDGRCVPGMRSPLALYVVGGALPAAGPVSAGNVVDGTWSAGGLYCIAVVGVVGCADAVAFCSWYCSYLESHHRLSVCKLGSSSGHALGEGSSSRSESYS